VAEREGQSDVRVWSFEPPVALNQRLYRCDKEFVLDPLKEIVEHDDIYALLVMDRREMTLALLKGKTIVPLVNSTSNVPGKFRAGGQSAARFESNRELMAHDFYKRIAEYMKDLLAPYGNELKGIIIGGPGPTKYELVESGYILDTIQKKIIGVKDITYTDEFGLQELLDKAQDLLAQAEVADEKRVMNQFFEMLNKQPAKVAYGKDEVKKFLEMSTVDTVLISEACDPAVVEEFEKIAEQFGSTLKIISTETREGVQLRDMGKFAAILRYEANH
jgi:peptide chain release factor subunit 1